MTEDRDNVIDIRPNMRVPADLSSIEALVYIRRLIEPLSYQLGERAVDLTLEAIRTIIAKALRDRPDSER